MLGGKTALGESGKEIVSTPKEYQKTQVDYLGKKKRKRF